MTKLKLGSLVNDKPVKLSIELPPSVHRDLVAYAEVLARETGQSIAEPAKLIAPMLERFMTGSLRKRGGCRHRLSGDQPRDLRCASARIVRSAGLRL